MDVKGLAQDTDYLRNDQYRDSSNLDARAEMHRRFGTNPIGWHQWVFNQMALVRGEEVLECGSGPGWLWRVNLNQIPMECRITLTDLSPGMVEEARTALEDKHLDKQFRVANIESLPFPDDHFDVMVANHMLYHVPDRERAFAEVRRVLRPGGRFLAATIGRRHMSELWDLIRSPSRHSASPDLAPDPHEWVTSSFGLENGRCQLEPWFGTVKLALYKDSLVVTEVEPIVAYLSSSPTAGSRLTAEVLDHVRRHVEQVIAAEGAFRITKSTGLFTAWLDNVATS